MAPTAHPTIRVKRTATEQRAELGRCPLSVTGVATGIPDGEPSPGHPGVEAVSIDTVTVALAGPPMRSRPFPRNRTRRPPRHSRRT